MNDVIKHTSFHRYKGILIAVTLFLVFNLSVLGLNFYTSSTLDSDAVSINLSGRQRMLSQRTTKVLLAMQVDAAQGKFNEKNTQELNKVVTLFDSTLNAFKNGGSVIGGDEKPVMLRRAQDAVSIKSVDEALRIWQPYKTLLSPVMSSKFVDEASLDRVTAYARDHNLQLLKLMNDLTTQLEKNTKEKARNLESIQTFALVLSLLLFANIIFNAMRKLRVADAETEKAQRETTEILNTVNEGLFLLNPELLIGTQFSKSMHKILQQEISANMAFMPILRALVSDEVYTQARNYIGLLFGNKVKENLVLSLNPLQQVQVQTKTGNQQGAAPRYLSFQFNRVIEEKRVQHLLVTVQDITEHVLHINELATLKGQANIDMALLEKLLKADLTQLRQFLTSAQGGLDDINEVLAGADKHGGGQDSAKYHESLVNQCFRIIHAIKGEAAALGLDAIELHAHQFEEQLVLLRKKTSWDTQEVLSLPVMLSAMLEQILHIETIVNVIQLRLPTATNPLLSPSISASMGDNLARLAAQVSQNQQKNVQLKLNLGLLDDIKPEVIQKLHQIGIQLVRNGIYHGIESAEHRVAKGKLAHGEISVSAHSNEEGVIHFVVRDDGQGIVPSRIRASMINSGRYASEDVAKLSDKEIVRKLFEPGFSTANVADKDAGRGVGMDLVQSLVHEIGGELKIETKPDVFTQITLRIAKRTTPLVHLNLTELAA